MRRTAKTIAASLLLACATLTVAAQESENGMKKQSAWSIKPQMGITMATLGGDDFQEIGSKMNWNTGVEVEQHINRHLGVSFGLLYTRTSFKDKSSLILGCPNPQTEFDRSDLTKDHLIIDQQRYTLHYLSFPILINVHLVKGLSLKAGYQPMIKVAARYRFHIYGRVLDYYGPYSELWENPSHYVDFNENVETSSEKLFHGFDVAIPLGLSYEWKNVFVDGRYHFCLCNTIKETDMKNRYLSLNIGYRFQL